MELLARLLIYVALCCLPFVLLVVASRRAEGCIWLMFPVVYGIPLTLIALLVFAPVESYLRARGLGHLQNVVVPLAAVPVGVVLFAVLGGWRTRKRMRSFGPVALLVVLMIVVGALWRLSAWVAAAIGLAGNA